ncbi:SDR family NAD(P)-dependent oxidoreductase [Chelativorans alearense]|uniref:SDR family NAD(P)-dependent oxidoreductase n=1 Tax=Chelativorans alearense TaxID=2681495 RepID=UPI0013D4C343|nr:SDR family oxidoreductase [Chelativorans alearense]
MTDRPLAGKTAFISGSGRNIGRAVAVQLAGLGANVVINGTSNRQACDDTAGLVHAQGTESLIVMGDMGRAEDIAAMSKAALDRFGTIDILVNNAAIRPHKPFLEMDESDWHSVVDTSLTAAFRTTQAFLPGMVDKGWGRIISMTGMKAIKGYFEGAPISAAKHGIWGLTKALATEFGPHGITANAVSPGQTLTEGRDGTDPKKLAPIPVGFMGTPEDVAAAVTFLASPASRFVNGQMIGVNGGQAT